MIPKWVMHLSEFSGPNSQFRVCEPRIASECDMWQVEPHNGAIDSNAMHCTNVETITIF